MATCALTPFTLRDGENMALYSWVADDSALANALDRPRGMVLLVHGLGEHAGRYDALAHRLIDWGFAVMAYDQRGHGRTGGARGVLPQHTTLLDDLAEVVDEARLRALALATNANASASASADPDSRIDSPGHAAPLPLPLIVLGHSLGGLVASRFVSLDLRPIDSLVLSSPALDAGMSWSQQALTALSLRVTPDWQVRNGLNANYLSHDPDVVSAYLADPQVHDKISPRLANFIATAGPLTIENAKRWTTPTLLMYAGDDHLVKAEGSKRFAQRATHSRSVTRGLVTAKCFEGLYHELFNESPDKAEAVFDTLQAWLNSRF